MTALPIYRFPVVAAALAMPSAALAQAVPPPRDAVIEQAIQDTLGASLKRRGYSSTDPKVIAAHQAVTADIAAATEQGRVLTGVSTANQTWAETIKGLLQSVARGFFTPIRIGSLFDKPNEGDGTYFGGGMSGGGGASGSWELDCSQIDISFDAQGNLIIPSYSLNIGLPMKFGSLGGPNNAFEATTYAKASSGDAALRWWMHKLVNSTRIPQRHYGVISAGPESGLYCAYFATVAYRDNENNLVPRETVKGCASAFNHNGYQYHQPPEVQCPAMETTGGDFHFYGDAPGWDGSHVHGCTMYAPNPTIGEGGYFINKKTTIPMNGTTFPASLPTGWKGCALDKSFMRRLTDAIARNALKTPTTPPYDPITDDDVRMPDANVNDLGDNPTSGTRPPPNETTVNTPPPPPPPSPPAPTPVDFGPDPGIGTPGDPQSPDNIMDPIFDWLPDLPSIQLNTAGATCPTWTMQPFQGPEWTLTMDDHCPFISDNQALISTIMILGFTVGAAMIILRA